LCSQVRVAHQQGKQIQKLTEYRLYRAVSAFHHCTAFLEALRGIASA